MHRLSIVLLLISFSACKESHPDHSTLKHSNYYKLAGKTMGTYYKVTHDAPSNEIQSSIDSLLLAINQSVSTYIDTSVISKINSPGNKVEQVSVLYNGKYIKQQRISMPADIHFFQNFEKAQQIWRQTDGYFDPTVMPLVNYWGFGYTPKAAVSRADSSRINQILTTIGLEQIQIESNSDDMTILKPSSLELDFSAIAKGYAVDQIAKLLTAKGAQNSFVDIGGEVSAVGINPSGKPWRIGLNKPVPEAALNEISEIVSLTNKSMASSGNYRNFHTIGNRKYGHQINPKTGYPEENELLGVSIITNKCMEADAVATACMIMGLEKAMTYVEERLHLEGCFFTSNEKGDIIHTATKGFEELIESH